MEKILVTIWCITYNHELFIRDAIESFLMQKTDFRYEIIIHDDASTDNTAEIVREYEEKYPDLIYGIYQTQNQLKKNQPNIKWLQDIAIQNCHGKYIAACEGDDYWLDIQKLQMQIDYLEMHPECVMTVHDTVDLDYKKHSVKARNIYAKDCQIPADDIILQKALLPTASMVYRKVILEMDGFFLDAGVGDYPCLLYALTKGTIYYFSRIMAVYRKGHAGSWRSSMENIKYNFLHSLRIVAFLKKYNEYSNFIYEKYVINKIQNHIYYAFLCFSKEETNRVKTLLQECDIETDNRYHDIIVQIEKLYMQIYDRSYLEKNIHNFFQMHKIIVIMGAGRYAEIVAEQLQYYGLSFKGFCVSDSQQPPSEYLGKPVWKLKELPFDARDIGVIIGINPILWCEIIEALKNANIKHYICPFLVY